MPFDGSRRLTGSNLFFDSAGAVLETVGVDIDAALLTEWRSRVARARAALHWPDRGKSIVARRHAAGTSLAVAAPVDQLFTATEINEWALCSALVAADPARWNHLERALVEAAQSAAEQASESETPSLRIAVPAAFAQAALPVIDEQSALARFAKLSSIEGAPRLRALIAAADFKALAYLVDDDCLTIGSGVGGQTWPLGALPDVDRVPWAELRNVPTAIVTGSNGKTTTVRLLAACARAHGWHDGYNCTDGLFIDGQQIERGDYSGPVGTRTILRDTRVQAAILETARGGILRRGLAARRARVAVVTNISADHFGEYGIDDLAGLADVKLVVANTVNDTGLLVLNADDALLRSRADQFKCPVGWFSRNYDDAMLLSHRMKGGATGGVRNGRLMVSWTRGSAEEIDLGAVAGMPLTVDGTADYNVQNVAGVALAALGLGIPPATLASVLARFGADPTDNPGRLMRYDYRGAQVLIDYAHNPDGLRGLMNVAVRLRRTGRVALLLGQAGNRTNADIEELAATAARFKPDFVVVKETESYLRGRSPGEVPAILRSALLRAGLLETSLEVHSSELGAVERALGWARPGDVLVLPVHDRGVRDHVLAMLSAQ
ncbi:MAG TPA: Mur ligase family protein [Steroidobacteraceae bacterium]|nr:Mur ligase family protein [Steroidobacteraceae bacterium]